MLKVNAVADRSVLAYKTDSLKINQAFLKVLYPMM